MWRAARALSASPWPAACAAGPCPHALEVNRLPSHRKLSGLAELIEIERHVLRSVVVVTPRDPERVVMPVLEIADEVEVAEPQHEMPVLHADPHGAGERILVDAGIVGQGMRCAARAVAGCRQLCRRGLARLLRALRHREQRVAEIP